MQSFYHFRASVAENPTIVRGPVDAVVQQHSDVVFRCTASGEPEPTTAWRKQKGVIPAHRYTPIVRLVCPPSLSRHLTPSVRNREVRLGGSLSQTDMHGGTQIPTYYKFASVTHTLGGGLTPPDLLISHTADPSPPQ